jgi:hypothetical protein
MSAAGIPQIAVVVGSCTAGSAYVPATRRYDFLAGQGGDRRNRVDGRSWRYRGPGAQIERDGSLCCFTRARRSRGANVTSSRTRKDFWLAPLFLPPTFRTAIALPVCSPRSVIANRDSSMSSRMADMRAENENQRSAGSASERSTSSSDQARPKALRSSPSDG